MEDWIHSLDTTWSSCLAVPKEAYFHLLYLGTFHHKPCLIPSHTRHLRPFGTLTRVGAVSLVPIFKSPAFGDQRLLGLLSPISTLSGTTELMAATIICS